MSVPQFATSPSNPQLFADSSHWGFQLYVSWSLGMQRSPRVRWWQIRNLNRRSMLKPFSNQQCILLAPILRYSQMLMSPWLPKAPSYNGYIIFHPSWTPPDSRRCDEFPSVEHPFLKKTSILRLNPHVCCLYHLFCWNNMTHAYILFVGFHNLFVDWLTVFNIWFINTISQNLFLFSLVKHELPDFLWVTIFQTLPLFCGWTHEKKI